MISFSLNPKLNVLMTMAEGIISFDEIKRHIEKEKLAGYLAKPELFDAREASTDLTSEQVTELVSYFLRLMRDNDLARTAIVTGNPVVFGMSRMLQTFSELAGGPEFRVFDTVQPGLAWLAEPPSGETVTLRFQ